MTPENPLRERLITLASQRATSCVQNEHSNPAIVAGVIKLNISERSNDDLGQIISVLSERITEANKAEFTKKLQEVCKPKPR
ncbi:MAG: hypothetical protein KBA40_03645 [Candidatus Peribacteraceae bacterium]|nr:hypothetical protein [Candidatus Peribacteraceae bacterium]